MTAAPVVSVHSASVTTSSGVQHLQPRPVSRCTRPPTANPITHELIDPLPRAALPTPPAPCSQPALMQAHSNNRPPRPASSVQRRPNSGRPTTQAPQQYERPTQSPQVATHSQPQQHKSHHDQHTVNSESVQLESPHGPSTHTDGSDGSRIVPHSAQALSTPPHTAQSAASTWSSAAQAPNAAHRADTAHAAQTATDSSRAVGQAGVQPQTPHVSLHVGRAQQGSGQQREPSVRQQLDSLLSALPASPAQQTQTQTQTHSASRPDTSRHAVYTPLTQVSANCFCCCMAHSARRLWVLSGCRTHVTSASFAHASKPYCSCVAVYMQGASGQPHTSFSRPSSAAPSLHQPRHWDVPPLTPFTAPSHNTHTAHDDLDDTMSIDIVNCDIDILDSDTQPDVTTSWRPAGSNAWAASRPASSAAPATACGMNARPASSVSAVFRQLQNSWIARKEAMALQQQKQRPQPQQGCAATVTTGASKPQSLPPKPPRASLGSGHQPAGKLQSPTPAPGSATAKHGAGYITGSLAKGSDTGHTALLSTPEGYNSSRRVSRESCVSSVTRQAAPMVLCVDNIAQSTPEVLEMEMEKMTLDELKELHRDVVTARR